VSESGTSYTSEITTPSGLTFHASIYVPPDAEHADQHELAEVAQMGASRMLATHEHSIEFRARIAPGAGTYADPPPC